VKAQAAPSAHPFALSLSKGSSFLLPEKRKKKGFDKLGPNGWGGGAGE
jgi:hypothetical protein